MGRINLGDDWQPRLDALREVAIATNQAYRVVDAAGTLNAFVIAHLHADGRIERVADEQGEGAEGANA